MILFKSPGLREQGSSPEQMDSGFANSRFCNSIFVILIRALTFLFGHQFSYYGSTFTSKHRNSLFDNAQACFLKFAFFRRSSFASRESTSGSGSDRRSASVSSDEMPEEVKEEVDQVKVVNDDHDVDDHDDIYSDDDDSDEEVNQVQGGQSQLRMSL